MGRGKRKQGSTSLPPQIPSEMEKLERAITLLGSRAKGELKPKVYRELLELMGKYPYAEQAAEWKKELKRIRKERLSESE